MGTATAEVKGAGMLEPTKRRRSTVDLLDDGLLIVVAIAGVLLLLQVVSWVVGTILFVVRLAVVAVAIGLALRVIAAFRRR